MLPHIAVKAAELLMEKHASFLLQEGWTVKIDKSKRRIGQCRYTKKEIGLSEDFIIHNTYKEIEQVILHEIAHALTPGHHHDHIWKLMAMSIGLINPTTCADFQFKRTPGKYVGICPNPNCQKIFYFHRKPKIMTRYCKQCGKEEGKFTLNG